MVSLPVTSRASVLLWALLAVAYSVKLSNICYQKLVESRMNKIFELWVRWLLVRPVASPRWRWKVGLLWLAVST
jgi:hypothetical protein